MAAMSAGENRRWLSWYLLLFSLLTVWGTWRWANALLVPASTARALAGGRPVGNNSDLYPRWLGAREALLHHRDPYSAALTREIQAGYYGRPLDARHLADPADQQAFAYPLYVVFLLAPTVSFPFPAVMHFFSWFLLLVTAASVLLWTRALAWRPPRTIQLVIVLLTLSTYPFVQGFYKQQLTLLVGFLLAAAAAATVRGWLALAGFLLALSTIKPQISCLLVFWFLIWSTGEWKSRKSLALSFAATLAALMIAAQLLQPGWLREFASALQAYRGYAADESLLQVLLTPFGGKLATAALIIFFAAICWWWRKVSAVSLEFAWLLALPLAITLAILNKAAPYNQVLLIPAALWLLADYRRNRHPRWGAKAASILSLACLVWQWITAFALAIASCVTPVRRLPLIQLPFYSIFAFPAMVLLALLLSIAAGEPAVLRPVNGRPSRAE